MTRHRTAAILPALLAFMVLMAAGLSASEGAPSRGDPLAIVPVAVVADDGILALDGAVAVDVFGVGDRTYAAVAAARDDGIQIVDVTDPAAPVVAGSITDGDGTVLDGAYDVAVFGVGGRTYAAVAALDDNAIQLVEIADPAAPVAVSGVADGPALLLEGAASVATLNVGRAVYALAVSMFENGIQVVDVTDPANPVPVHVRGGDAPASSGTARDLAVFERDGSVYAVVATGFFENSLRILEVVPDGSLDVHGAVPPLAPVSAAYRPLTGSVTVTFDAPLGPAVHVDRLHVREAGRGDAGVALSGMPTVEGAILTVALDAGRAGSVGAMASPLLDVGGGAVQDMYGNPVPAAAGLPLDVPDAVPPVLDSATYHNSTGLLSVSFSEPIDHAATDYPGLAVIGPSGNLTMADAADRATPDGETIAATLDQTRRGMVGPGSALRVSGGPSPTGPATGSSPPPSLSR